MSIRISSFGQGQVTLSGLQEDEVDHLQGMVHGVRDVWW